MGLIDRVDALRHRPLIHLMLWQLGIAASETQTTEAERDCLAQYAGGKRMLAEVGVYHGVTTCRLRKAMDPGGVLFAIDPYPKQRLGFSAQRIVARREVGKIKRGTVKWVRTTGAEAARELSASGWPLFDFLFIDGDHTWDGLKGDWEGWSPLIAPGGIVALHDSRSSPCRQIDDAGSVRFTREVIASDPDFETVDTVDSLTVLRRRKQAEA
jgi:predicted O-methyltransferase YrrM